MTHTLKKLITLLIILSFSCQSIGVDSTLYTLLYPLSEDALRPVASKLAGQTVLSASADKSIVQNTTLDLLSVKDLKEKGPEIIFKKIEQLHADIIHDLLILERNINKERRMPDQVLLRFLKNPRSITIIATDTETHEVIGYIFGLPQSGVPETNFTDLRLDINKVFYEMSWQVKPGYRGKNIGTLLRRQFRDEVRNAGYSYLATHQYDIFDQDMLGRELLERYTQGDILYELKRGLPPPPGISEKQQYVVIRLNRSAAKSSSARQQHIIDNEDSSDTIPASTKPSAPTPKTSSAGQGREGYELMRRILDKAVLKVTQLMQPGLPMPLQVSDKEYKAIVDDFAGALSNIITVKSIEFSQPTMRSAEEHVVISGAIIKEWEDTSLHLCALNPDGSTPVYPVSGFREASFVIPRTYLMDERVRKLILDLARNWVIGIHLSEYSAFATTDAIVEILENALSVAKRVRALEPEAIGDLQLLRIEENKTIIVDTVSSLPRMGYVLHPSISFWPKQGIGISLEVSRETLKTLAVPGSEFRDWLAHPSQGAFIPFALSKNNTFEEYVHIMERIRGFPYVLPPAQQQAVIGDYTTGDDSAGTRRNAIDTTEESLLIQGAFSLENPTSFAKRQIIEHIKSKAESVPGFFLRHIILATVKGMDEKELFTVDGEKTPFICWEEGVLVVHAPTFSFIHYATSEEMSNILKHVISAVVRLKIFSLQNRGFDAANLNRRTSSRLISGIENAMTSQPSQPLLSTQPTHAVSAQPVPLSQKTTLAIRQAA